MTLAATAIVGYLIGTISFSRIAGRLILPGVDLSETEYAVEGTDETWTYRGVSATSVLERAGWKWGVAVIVWDAMKAFVPIMGARLAGAGPTVQSVLAVAIVIGHVWPLWWRFDGGRGQSCLLGALLAIDIAALVFGAITGVVVGLMVFTSSYLARNIGPALLVPWFWWAAGVGPYFWFAVAFNIVYWIALRGDLGEEQRARVAREVPQMRYRARLAVAWDDFVHED